MIGLGYGNFQSGTQEPFSFGNALQSDGVNDYVQVPNFDYTTGGNFTINLWCILSSGFTTNNPYLLGHGSTNKIIILGNSSSNRAIRWGVTGAATAFSRITGTLFGEDTWLMLTMVRNGNVFTLYKNAIQIDTITSAVGTITLATDMQIFKHPTSSIAYWKGLIDEMGVWNTNLSVDDIEGLNNSMNGDYATNYQPANLISYKRFNGVSNDSIAVDQINTGINGTLNNFDFATCWVPHTPSFSFGNALRFDGINDYVSLISSVPDVTQQTMSWWSRIYGTTGLGYFFSTADASGANREGLRLDGRIASNYGEVGYFDGGSPINVITTVGTPTNWNHFQMVRNGTNFQLFLNGVSVYNATITNMSDREIAKFGLLGSNYFMGDMQEIAIWQNVLGDVTSAGLGYNLGNGNLATDMGLGTPNRYYRCNGTSGDSVLVDEGSDLVNGVLNNFDFATCWVAH
jgi:hypothetical protein